MIKISFAYQIPPHDRIAGLEESMKHAYAADIAARRVNIEIEEIQDAIHHIQSLIDDIKAKQGDRDDCGI